MRVRTWHVELAVVWFVLANVCAFTAARLVDAIGALAVLASFAHGQVAARLAEREAARPRATVECHRMLGRYYVVKEALWLAFFVCTGAYAALAGVAIFLLYPIWRAWWRRQHPIEPTP